MKIYELSARYDARKSFYNRAHVVDYYTSFIAWTAAS